MDQPCLTLSHFEPTYKGSRSNTEQLTKAEQTKHFFDLGFAYHQRYVNAHLMEDLENAIKHYRAGLGEDPVDKAYHGLLLNNLAAGLGTRFEQLGQIKDLEEAMACRVQSLELHPTGHPMRAWSLNSLGNILLIRYEQLKETTNLEEAIAYYEQALALRPPGHPDRSESLNNFANAFRSRYQQFSEMKDLNAAIDGHKESLELHPLGHTDRLLSLKNLANALHTRYQKLGEMKDLKEAITWNEQALELCPPGHPDRSNALNNLADSLHGRYKQLRDANDVKKAIALNEQALKLRPLGHPDRSLSLYNLGNALFTRHEQDGGMKDLKEAITCYEKALQLCPPGHPDRFLSLNNFANSLHTRYQRLGQMRDLQNAITYHEQALKLCPPGHSDRSTSLISLANTVSTRYKQLGEVKDLEDVIIWNKEALELHPPGHSLRSLSFNNLASSLSIRYEQLGEMKDLEEAIYLNRQALELHQSGNPDKIKPLNNLAGALLTKYQQFEDISDLEEAIACHQQALDLWPLDHPNKYTSLNGLANALVTRYDQLEEMKDLDKAITCYEQALELQPSGHPDRPLSLSNYATALLDRFDSTGSLSNLELATANYKAALACLLPYHPFHCRVFSGLALLNVTVHKSIWVICDNCSHIEDACMLLKEAAHHVTSTPYDQFTAARKWASTAHNYQHKSAITAYSTALELQQQHLALLPSVLSQQQVMGKSPQLSLNAASCAISAGELEMAVQFLEQGRSILWSKIQGYRQPLDEISKKDAQLAKELRIVAHQLEHNAVTTDADIVLQRSLAEKWKNLLQKIRKLDGFSDFLQAVPFSNLKKAADEGPIIMINVSSFQTDALILVSSGPVVVSLSDASPEMLGQLLGQLLEITNGTRPNKDILSILQHLWNDIVHPVVKTLAQLEVPEKSRIWWCPTSSLCALPVHAAGPYTSGANNLPYLYTSSYTPTLTSLIKARLGISKSQTTLSMLLVSQADDTIPKVAAEVEAVKKFKKDIFSCSGQDAHKEAVLAGLQSHSWVHFACHGHLEAQPFNSWFQLHSGDRLTILDLAKAQLPNAEFAFLSACHSAAGDIYGTPDESIHLAAALQFCGFRSVIGTLWAMVDNDGPALAHAFYSHMFRNGDNVNLRDAAEALNLATRKLKKQHVTLDRRINFIHIGA